MFIMDIKECNGGINYGGTWTTDCGGCCIEGRQMQYIRETGFEGSKFGIIVIFENATSFLNKNT